jgi:acetyl-CoA carboxylase, biotin carboxylase subunit
MNFAPSPGRLEYYVPSGGPHVRVDSACYSGYSIPPNYDSMIAKVIVKGKDRKEALQVGERALREFHVGGVKTTVPFHLDILTHAAFIDCKYDLGYVDGLTARGYQFGKEAHEPPTS